MIEKKICRCCSQPTIKTPLKTSLFNLGFCSIHCLESYDHVLQQRKKAEKEALKAAKQLDLKRTKAVYKRIDENTARQVKARLSENIKTSKIARELGLPLYVIYSIRDGKSWKHVS